MNSVMLMVDMSTGSSNSRVSSPELISINGTDTNIGEVVSGTNLLIGAGLLESCGRLALLKRSRTTPPPMVRKQVVLLVQMGCSLMLSKSCMMIRTVTLSVSSPEKVLLVKEVVKVGTLAASWSWMLITENLSVRTNSEKRNQMVPESRSRSKLIRVGGDSSGTNPPASVITGTKRVPELSTITVSGRFMIVLGIAVARLDASLIWLRSASRS